MALTRGDGKATRHGTPDQPIAHSGGRSLRSEPIVRRVDYLTNDLVHLAWGHAVLPGAPRRAGNADQLGDAGHRLVEDESDVPESLTEGFRRDSRRFPTSLRVCCDVCHVGDRTGISPE